MELIVLRGGEECRIHVEQEGHLYRVRVGERDMMVDSTPINGAVRSLIVGGRQFEVAVRRSGVGQYQVSYHGSIEEVEVLDPITYLASQGTARRRGSGPHSVTAYMPGRVVELLVAEGDQVVAGQGLVVLEAMKMENEIQAEHDGVVKRILVTAGQAVEGGDPMFEIE